MFDGPAGLGLFAPAFRHDGFDTRDWLVGQAWRRSPTHADPTTRVLAARRGRRDGRAGVPLHRDASAIGCGRTTSRRSTSRRPRSQWDASRRHPRGRDLRPLPGPRRARGVPDHDAPRRERVRRAVRAGAVHPADPSALHRGRAVPRDAGERRGAAHRGVHEARARQRRWAPALDRADAGVAAVACSSRRTSRRPRSCCRVLGEGTFLEYLSVRRALRARPRDRRHRAAGACRRGAARRLRGRARPALPGRGPRPARASFARPSSAARRSSPTRAAAVPTSRRRSSCSRPAGSRPSSLQDGVRAVRDLHEQMHRRRVTRLTQLGFAPAVAEEISELHTPNFM